MNKFYLPRLQKLSIKDYSLYNCPLDISFSHKLNIIYGTNGTGKSTLLMMCFFSIVGPYRGGIKTKVRQEQRRDNRPIYEDFFFKDRMKDGGNDATVTSTFTINKDMYVVTHSLLDGKLIKANVNGLDLPGKQINYKTYETKYTQRRAEEKSDEELKEYLIYNYQEKLSESTNLPGGFNTLISMLLDIMFFDEGRKLTFWNTDLQETVIGKYIVDADFYEEYCERKLTTKALESAYKKKSETYNFMNKFLQREKEDKQTSSNNEMLRRDLFVIENKTNKLDEQLQDNQKLYSRKNKDYLISAHLEEKTKEELDALDEVWYKNLFPSPYEKYHGKFINQMINDICPICGNKHLFSVEYGCCIMCGEKLELNDSQDMIAIDNERRQKSKLLSETKRMTQALATELNIIRKRTDETRREINKLNTKANEIRVKLEPDDDHGDNSDEKRLEKAFSERIEALAEYNNSKKIEDEMRRTIEEKFVDNFSRFRASFLRYASSFFGMQHTENLLLPFNDEETQSGSLMKFELDGKIRDEDYMLSESQRIFTDLSFRFSVLTTFHDKSFFVCETPDSTLDMFHEEMAVKTFLEYIQNGNALFLSANARYSNLISSLYKSFSPEEVTVIDLTQLSRLALPMQYSFYSYIKGEQ